MTPADQVMRGMLAALGHDPDTHWGEAVHNKRKAWEGIRVLDAEGEPVRFYNRAALDRAYEDPASQAAFLRECPETP